MGDSFAGQSISNGAIQFALGYGLTKAVDFALGEPKAGNKLEPLKLMLQVSALAFGTGLMGQHLLSRLGPFDPVGGLFLPLGIMAAGETLSKRSELVWRQLEEAFGREQRSTVPGEAEVVSTIPTL